MTRMSVMPARTHSSTTYWMAGLSTSGIISLGWAFDAGRKRVPSPAAGMTALRTGPNMTLFLPHRRWRSGRGLFQRPAGPVHLALVVVECQSPVWRRPAVARFENAHLRVRLQELR